MRYFDSPGIIFRVIGVVVVPCVARPWCQRAKSANGSSIMAAPPRQGIRAIADQLEHTSDRQPRGAQDRLAQRQQ